MRAVDIILKKRDGKTITKDEIQFFVTGYTNGDIPDYQASALLMAIYFSGMNDIEIADFTYAMAHSGTMIDLSDIPGIKVDKHSTGGVGDKVTLVALPIAAACGLPIAKMSGRALGHTGGTVDKLESIPGYKTELTQTDFINQVKNIGISLIGQTQGIAPADKKLYALRDTTATVDNIGLISASIMSKKLASGADAYVLDVKMGNGAFAKDLDFATKLADTMVAIAKNNGKKAKAIITNMDQPLGMAVGNWLEIVEVVQTLQGKGPKDLTYISKEIAANMLYLGEKGDDEKYDLDTCRNLADQAIQNGSALLSLYKMLETQGVDIDQFKSYFAKDYNEIIFPKGYKIPYKNVYIAKQTGYITYINTESIGIAAGIMGAARETMADTVDYGAGIVFHKKLNDHVQAGDAICELYSKNQQLTETAIDILDKAILISETKIKDITLIYT